MSLSTDHENLVSVLPIPQNANYCFTNGMDVHEIRFQNLVKVKDKLNQREFAEFVGMSDSYLSQIFSPNLRGKVGADIARRIERKYKLPHGWMDIEHKQELSAQARSVAEAVDSQGYAYDALEQLANYLLNQTIQFHSIHANSSQSPAPKEMGTNTGSFPALQARKKTTK